MTTETLIPGMNGISLDSGAPPPRRALILYATQTGTAEDLSFQLSSTLERHRFLATLLPCDDFDVSLLPEQDLVFLVVSTTGQGEIPDNAKHFWRGLLRKKLPAGWLANVRFGVFCLGDSTYPKFCWAGRKVGRRLLQLGAREVVRRGEGDQSGEDGIEGAFAYWLEEVRSVLRTEWPPVEEIPDKEALPSKWLLSLSDSEAAGTGPQDGWEVMRSLHAPRADSILATVAENARVTPEDHWQDVRHLRFSLPPDVEWEPGATVSICPKNFPEDVELFLSLQGWTEIADRPLELKPSPHLAPGEHPPCPIPAAVQPLTLRTLLTHHLDITAIPRRSFFALAAHLTSDETHRERLSDFADPVWVEELWDYTTRPRRSLLEVLQEFNTIRIPLSRLLELVPRMRERQFSIASAAVAQPGTLDLLVAIVNYRTIIKKTRRGVCTRFLASLRPGEDQVALCFHRGALALKESDLQKPVVCVGPGTGVAPMRALLQHRVALGAEGGNVLFFGARNKGKDFFFGGEWGDLERQGKLRLFTAFSRDQKHKRYVQTVIREQAREVWKALGEGQGIVFVCGSSGRMPSAVREALVEVFSKCGGMEYSQAEQFLEAMEKGGRYKQETW
jgi:sulfite reductase alpha subunit-like flavoprotein